LGSFSCLWRSARLFIYFWSTLLVVLFRRRLGHLSLLLFRLLFLSFFVFFVLLLFLLNFLQSLGFICSFFVGLFCCFLRLLSCRFVLLSFLFLSDLLFFNFLLVCSLFLLQSQLSSFSISLFFLFLLLQHLFFFCTPSVLLFLSKSFLLGKFLVVLTP